MSTGPLLWTRDGYEEWARWGALRASITRQEPDEKNIVTVKVRIALLEASASDDTPTYFYLPAGGLAEGLEALKRDLERELMIRAESSGS